MADSGRERMPAPSALGDPLLQNATKKGPLTPAKSRMLRFGGCVLAAVPERRVRIPG